MSLAIAVILATSAQAQVDPAKNYPNKPIQVIVGFPPGGGTDIIARIVGQKLSEGLGQPVLVQTKVGAMGSIAAESVAKATPDGYTLMFAPGGVFTTNPVTYAKLPYSPVRDFVPISTVVEFPLFLIVNASQPIHSVKELVNYLKANPKNTYYSGSAGLYQLVFELFKLRSNQSNKSELVIFLRPTILRDSSIDGDASFIRSQLSIGTPVPVGRRP